VRITTIRGRLCASAAAICRSSKSIRERRRALQRHDRDRQIDRRWRALEFAAGRARAAMIIRICGSAPTIPRHIALVGDQGAIITVNGGATWSSWFNQPTAQLYHIGITNGFPYRICSGQQESGSVCMCDARQ
jgi:hypothetical protein